MESQLNEFDTEGLADSEIRCLPNTYPRKTPHHGVSGHGRPVSNLDVVRDGREDVEVRHRSNCSSITLAYPSCQEFDVLKTSLERYATVPRTTDVRSLGQVTGNLPVNCMVTLLT